MSFRVAAMLAVAVWAPTVTLGSSGTRSYDDGESRASDFQRRGIQYFGVDLDATDDGRIVATAAWNGPATQEEIVCAFSDSRRSSQWSPIDFHVAQECLGREMPGLDLAQLHQKTVADVQDWIDSLPLPPANELSAREFRILRSSALARLERLLSNAGVGYLLSGAYRRHVQRRSVCGVEVREELQDFARDHPCELWPRIIAIQSGHAGSLAGVGFRFVDRSAPEQSAAAQLQAVGLPKCLENLLEYASDYGEILESGPCGYPFRPCAAIDHAWAVWRSHGLDRWLEKTQSAGAVPPEIEATITACAEQRIFPGPGLRDEVRRPPLDVENPHLPAWFPKEFVDPEQTGPMFERPAMNSMFSLTLDGETDPPRLVPQLRILGEDRKSIACKFPQNAIGAGDEAAQSVVDLWIAQRCLVRDGPGLNLRALYEEALGAVQEHWNKSERQTRDWNSFDEQSGKQPLTLAERLLKESQLEGRLRRELYRAGLAPYIQGAWHRHVTMQSGCYLKQQAALRRQAEELIRSGARCPPGSWPSVIDLNPPERISFERSASIDGHLAPDHPYHLALDKLDGHGLRTCLDGLLEEYGDRRQMEKLGMFDIHPFGPDAVRRRRYVWRVWRQFGLERWIRETALTGEVSNGVAETIRKCTARER